MSLKHVASPKRENCYGHGRKSSTKSNECTFESSEGRHGVLTEGVPSWCQCYWPSETPLCARCLRTAPHLCVICAVGQWLSETDDLSGGGGGPIKPQSAWKPQGYRCRPLHTFFLTRHIFTEYLFGRCLVLRRQILTYCVYPWGIRSVVEKWPHKQIQNNEWRATAEVYTGCWKYPGEGQLTWVIGKEVCGVMRKCFSGKGHRAWKND